MYFKWLRLLSIFLGGLVLMLWVGGESINASDLTATAGQFQNGLSSTMNDSITIEKILFSNTPYSGDNEIYMMNTDGSGIQKLTNHAGRDCGPAWSPDRKKIAFYVHYDDNNWSEFVMDANGSNIIRLTNTPNVCDGDPNWSPDGKQIAFARWYPLENYRSEVWVMDADGNNQHRIGTFDGGGPDWSQDGSKIVFYSNISGIYHICVADTDGTNLQQLTNTGTENWWPSYSADGSKIAFQSNRDGNHEIYVMNADGINQVRLTNNPAEDGDPCWSPDGNRIAFSSFRDGKYEIYRMNAGDGSNQTRLTTMQIHNIQPDWGSVCVQMNKYLGQSPPDSIPKIFAPGIVSTTNGAEYACAFTPDGTEFYFTRYDEATATNNIWVTKLSYNQWTTPVFASFTQDYSYNIEPNISPDGQKLFFISERPGGTPPRIWYVDRIDTSWSAPHVIGEPLSSLGKMGPSVAANGNLYFCQLEGNNHVQIYMAKNNNGVYETPVKLGNEINSFYIAAHPFIAADENYLLFDALPNYPTSGESFLYISFKRPDDSWYPAIKLNNLINATSFQYCASISPDGKYLFFTRGDQDIYWADTKALCILGDADNSGSIDISDVIYLINYLFRGGPAPEPMIAGDSNNDNKVTVSDAVYLINYLFKDGPKPSC